MSDLAIRVEGLGKRYRIGQREPYKALRDVLARAPLAPYRWLRSRLDSENGKYEENHHIWALRDVSFEVKRGEVIGIIGRNGAGKSTLLKILSRITRPTRGYADIYGRVGSLLEVGTGFHPELTGRENIYLNGAILGMRRNEIERKFDEIVGFSGLEKFIDTPVKRYSSGMYVRLAFSVAAHLETEILLVDEVLAVGDADFQRKCLGKMGEISGGGRTVIFVSHNMEMIETLCERVLLLKNGNLNLEGPSDKVIQFYLSNINDKAKYIDLAARTDRYGSGEYRFSEVWITNDKDEIIGEAITGQTCHIHALLVPHDSGINLSAAASISVYDSFGNELTVLASMLIDKKINLDGKTEVVWKICNLQLSSGEYPCNLFLSRSSSGTIVYGVIDLVRHAFVLSVRGGDYYGTGRTARKRKIRFYIDFDVLSRRVADTQDDRPSSMFERGGSLGQQNKVG